MTNRFPRRPGAASVAVTAALLAGLVGSLTAAPAHAVAADPDLFCDIPGQELAISPIADLQDGDSVTWLSTVKGTTPTSFTGEYVGKLDNGLGYDASGNPRDLLLVKLDGDIVNGAPGSLAAGVWSGASGSPVYDADGALIGAVSYGFSFLADNVAGVTPAAYMKAIGQLPGIQKLSPAATNRAARMAGEEAVAETGTIRRLEPVRVTTGTTARSLDAYNASLAKKVEGFRGVAASGRAIDGGANDGADYPIVVGGNIAVSYAYGAVGEASVGTVTAICGDEVFAYGHPGNWNSKLSANIHGASAARIVPDLTGSYKLVSAIGKVKGKLVDDRLAGVRGLLGAGTATVPITTTSLVGSHRSTAVSHVSEKQLIAAAAYTQVGNEVARMLDNGQEASAKVSWSIVYQRASGAVATLKNIDRYADPNEIAAYVGAGVADDIAQLQANPFEDVKIVSVAVTARFAEDYRAARLAGVQMLKKGTWTTLTQGSVTKVTRGSTYTFRAVLSPVPGAARVTEYSPFTVSIPKGVKKTMTIALAVPGFGDGFGEEAEEPKTFSAFIAALDDNARSDVFDRTRTYTSTHGLRVARTSTTVAPTVLIDDGKTVLFRLEAPALSTQR